MLSAGVVCAQNGNIVDGPSSLYLQGYSMNIANVGVVDYGSSPFVKTSSYDNGPGNRGVYYTATNGSAVLTVQIKQGTITGNPPWSLSLSYWDSAAGRFGFVSYGGDSYDSMTSYASQNIVDFPAAFGGTNFVNGLDAVGLPVGGAGAQGGGEASSAAAETLTTNLIFSDGTWQPVN